MWAQIDDQGESAINILFCEGRAKCGGGKYMSRDGWEFAHYPMLRVGCIHRSFIFSMTPLHIK